MLPAATKTKISSIFDVQVLNQIDALAERLERGDLYGFEEGLYEGMVNCYNAAAQAVILEVSSGPSLVASQRSLAARLGVGKLEFRRTWIQLRTGFWAQTNGLYAKRVPGGYEGTRHLLHLWWSVMESASPAFYSLVCLYSVLCCSYDVAKQVLQMQYVQVGFDRMRLLANRISAQCVKSRQDLVLKEGETLKGKRVFISLDGGRTRTRCYVPEKNRQGTHHKFTTPWKEPKMLVISVMDDDGKAQEDCLPIYDCSFGDDEILAVLRQYLAALDIDQAELIQVVADGAPWIWNRVKPMLVALGVAPEKIVETVDYYHAAQNLHKAIEYLPEKTPTTTQQLKDMLWQGQTNAIVQKFQQLCPDWDDQTCETILGYFTRNTQRMKYQSFKERNLTCGSGIMESAVRRVICLRFKCPSSFWNLENLEGLILFRSVLLAKRWDILINNLARCP